jgi:ligand-binding SRPBCC domain-containing protein
MKMRRFTKQSEIFAPVQSVFAFHEQEQAIEQLIPPWERAEVLERSSGVRVGTRTVIKVFAGPFARLWVAEHTEYVKDRLFADIQRSGPFAYWYHRHLFEPTDRGTTLYTDDVEYALPFGWLGDVVAGLFVRGKLQRMFDYRHKVVAERVG